MTGDPHDSFPPGFFRRTDESSDDSFYAFDRLVTHIDTGAIRAVGDLYRELGLVGDVLDICSSWISHFHDAPRKLVVMGMNGRELDANPMASERVVKDLNLDPTLPFGGDRFDAVTCCASIDYLVRPIDVMRETARVLRSGGVFVCTFSNRCFPTKAIHGWLATDDAGRCRIVSEYFRLSAIFEPATVSRRVNLGPGTDPLYAVWARCSTEPDIH